MGTLSRFILRDRSHGCSSNSSGCDFTSSRLRRRALWGMVCFGTCVAVTAPKEVAAQQPYQLELTCPAGSVPLTNTQTFNQTTNKFRQELCVHQSVHILFN